MNWMEFLDERQQKELQFAQSYASQFAHGTDGHHRLLLIAHLARILDSFKLVAEKQGWDVELEEIMAEVRDLLNKTT